MSLEPRVRRTSKTRSSHRGRHSSSSKSMDGNVADQSSWIADDICTHCGALAPHGKLYCSEKCREKDSQSLKDIPAENEKEEELSKTLSQLRYPMTLSPHLTAATSGLPLFPKQKVLDSHQTSGSSASCCERRAEHGGLYRSPSHSSGSAASDKSDSELTPSPWHAGLDLDEQHGDISDDDELALPPSVLGSTSFISGRSIGVRMQKFKSGSFSSPKGPLWSSPALVPHSMAPTRSVQSHIQFTRMPCSTNIQSSVIFANPMNSNRPNVPATLRRLGSDSQTERHSPPILTKSRSNFSFQNQDHPVDTSISKRVSTETQDVLDPVPQDTDLSTLPSDQGSDSALSDVCHNCNRSIQSDTSEKVLSIGSSDEPCRGRSRMRTGHSCCSGHRRLDAAACDPYCILSINRHRRILHPVPSTEFVFPLCPTEPSA